MHHQEHIRVRKSDLIDALSTLETIVVSLDRIGSCHAELEQGAYDKITTEFVEQWDICRRLLAMRKTLSNYFSDDLGDEDMDELERALHETPHWQRHHRKPPKGY